MSSALVLGGGGLTGLGWQIGLLAGLAAGGVAVTEADLVVGTSAGAVTGALITTGIELDASYETQLAAPSAERRARLGLTRLVRLMGAALVSRSPTSFARRAGRIALSTRTISEAKRREVIASRLPRTDWPRRQLVVVAVDAHSGAAELFDRNGAASLIDAVAASCAVPGVWPPVSIGSRRFIDGWVRSFTNLDLAAGHDRVLVVAPVDRPVGPLPRVEDQCAELRGAGAEVRVLRPDAASRAAMGRNPLDPARRTAAARAGRDQAVRVLFADEAGAGEPGIDEPARAQATREFRLADFAQPAVDSS